MIALNPLYMRLTLILLILLVLAALPGFAEVSFNRDIRPIMSDTCFRCHGPDKNARMAGLRLDLRDEALKKTRSGITPIVPGKPEESAIVARVFSTTPVRLMPPVSAHKVLTDKQKDTIRQWVAEGAKYEGHWAYQPLRRPAPPQSGKENPIDAFLAASLAKEGLSLSPEADRRTLLRRVSLDLTGIPLTPEEAAKFVTDKTPGAYANMVDRLLASPRYAEKQTRLWLDAVRYADTCGFHGDNPFPAWPYRDYVLNSFRDNKPFDHFTREQLAGDLMPNATTEQKVASAYNRMNRTSAEGGLQPVEYLAKYGADRVRTTSVVWLGSTMGCAECHDHKFDPFLSKDFYSMKAFFADIKETGLVPDKGPKAWGTVLSLPTQNQVAELAAFRGRMDAEKVRLARTPKPTSEQRAVWEKKLLGDYKSGRTGWKMVNPASMTSINGAKLSIDKDSRVIVSGPNLSNETYIVTLKPGVGTWTGLGLEVNQDDSLPGLSLARGADRFVITEVEAERNGTKLDFAFARGNTTASAMELPALTAIDGDSKTGWGALTYGDTRMPFLALTFQQKLTTGVDDTLTVRIRQDSTTRRATIGRFRIGVTEADAPWPDPNRKTKPGGLPDDVLKALETASDKRTSDHKKALDNFYEQTTNPNALRLAFTEARANLLESSIPKVVVTEAGEPQVTRILPRGNFLDESGEVVLPAIPQIFGKLQTQGRATRLNLANWLVTRDNPLTARVFVNRTWRQLFGTGLSKVLDDVGSQGEWPVHAELLDWLASEFMEPTFKAEGAHAWDVKHLIRTIVLSETYRQSSAGSKDSEDRDPDNRLLSRQSRFRVDAEEVRDVALAVSGLLNEKFGGPSVRPYQPDGYLASLNFPKREYAASRGDDLYRRGLYTHWQRTFLHPSLMTFDAPSREECVVNRTNSNTPLQALVMLNDPTFVESARVFAQNMQRAASGVPAQLNWGFEKALNRKPTAEESKILRELHKKSLAEFQTNAESAKVLLSIGEAPLPSKFKTAELAAMTSVARAILNLHETITRN